MQTGKTKVLTTRLANLIYKKLAKTTEILAVTFTNKAALEMFRVEKILNIPVEGMFTGTFHWIDIDFRKQTDPEFKNDFTILEMTIRLRLIKTTLLLFASR